VLLLGAVLVAIISSLAYWIGSRAGRRTRRHPAEDLWTFLLRNVIIALVVTALALRYFYVTHEWRHNVKLQAKARYALQARIRPHFLFNSMTPSRADPQQSGARRKGGAGSPICSAPTSMKSTRSAGRGNRRGAHLPAHRAAAAR
jgi:hypothetical protein